MENDDPGSKSREKQHYEGKISIANRDKPLFASMRQRQHRPEFFTESLNSTLIPSPSPSRPGHRANTKPRQTLGHTRGLEAAIKSVQSRRDGNKPSSIDRAPERLSHQVSPKRSPSRLPVKSSTSPPPSEYDRSAMHTPSPPRGRQPDTLVSPTSDASASSPPRGLAEAYQRITDEEDLAAQEGNSEDDLDNSEEVDASQIFGNSQQQSYGHVLSPSSRRSSHVLSPQPPSEVSGSLSDAAFLEAEDNTRGSTRSNPFEQSGEESTDLGVFASRRERDQRRVNGVLGNDSQPFAKARRRGRSGLTIDHLRREDASSQSGSSSRGSNAASSISNSSFNIPQGWGRKARNGRTWLSRITQENDSEANRLSRQNSPLQETSAPTEKSKHESIIDWQMAASATPLPAVESDSLKPEESLESTPREPTPQHLSRHKPSFELARKWELNEDDCARSFQQSDTPNVRIRGAAIDAIREREIQRLARSALTTNRLGELKEQRSLDRIGRRSTSRTVRDAKEEQDLGVVEERGNQINVEEKQSTSDDEKGKKPQIRVEALLEDDNGTPIPDSPVVVFKDRPQSPESADSQRSELHSRWSGARPSDTREVLRKLARMTSQSPERAKADSQSQNQSVPDEGVTKPVDDPSSNQTEIRASNLESKVSGFNDQARAFHHIDNTPVPPKPAAYLKTPLVTGAWIETPIPKSVRQAGLEADAVDPAEVQKSQELVNHALFDLGMGDIAKKSSVVQEPTQSHIPLEETAPTLPKSALAAIIERAKSHRDRSTNVDNSETLQLDDSTIASLEELLASSNDEVPASSPPTPSESCNLPTPFPSTHKAPSKSTYPKKHSETEAQSYAHLASRLTHLRSSITEAKQDVGSLQKRLRKPQSSGASRSQSQPPRRTSSIVADATECDEAGEFHDFIWPCERCGHTSSPSSMMAQDDVAAAAPWDWHWQPVLIPRLWRWRTSSSRLPRPTKVGLWIVIAFALITTELILW